MLDKKFENEDLETKYEKQKKMRLQSQLGTFLICYLFWMSVHMQRSYWSMAKKTILKDPSS